MTKPPKSTAPRPPKKRATVAKARHRGAATSSAPSNEQPLSSTTLVRPDAGGIATLASDVRQLVEAARHHADQAVNIALTHLHWQVGRRIQRDILGQKRAEYGKEIVSTLSRELVPELGRGFSPKALHHMLRFHEAFPDPEIVSTLSRQLSWSHFLELVYLKSPLQREFYAEMCRVERWSVRTLRQKVDAMLYERTALARKPEALIRKELAALRERDEQSPAMVLQDPYVLDFLGLADTYSERDLESAILREIERFLLELGAGFTFVERQKRITLDGDDHYIDLLFFHRPMRRLVVIELKIGDFKPADAGQVELYLRWLDRHERQPSEERPLGVILCAGKKRETVEILDLDGRGIHVAEYLTQLPPREVLEDRLHRAIAAARQRLEAVPSPLPASRPAKPAGRGRRP